MSDRYKLNPFTGQFDRVADLTETIQHSDLSDMPDVGGTNSDHDARYFTESESDLRFLKLDQTTPQTISGGFPLTSTGWQFTNTTPPSAPPAGSMKVYAVTTQGHTRMETMDEDGTRETMLRDNILLVRNTSGSPMTMGQVVYVTGSTGNVPNVALAKSDSLTTLPAIGFCFEDIANNGFGEVMVLGIISGIATSAFASGDRVYVSSTTAGALTNVRPVSPLYAQRMGTVGVSGVGNGSIQVIVAPFLGGEESGTTAATFAGSAFTGTSFTGTSFVIGANTLTTSEWAFLDGQDQGVKTTSTPQFARLGLGQAADATFDLAVNQQVLIAQTTMQGYVTGDNNASNNVYLASNAYYISGATWTKPAAKMSAAFGSAGDGSTYYKGFYVYTSPGIVAGNINDWQQLMYCGTKSTTDTEFRVDTQQAGIGGAASTQRFIVVPNSATQIGQVIQGFAAQSADLQRWQNSTPTVLASISAAGHWLVEGVTSTGATGTGKFVFDGSPTLVTPTLGVATATSITISGLTTTRIPYASAGGLLVDSANLTFDGTNLIVGDPTLGSAIKFLGAAGTNRDLNFFSGSSSSSNLRWALRANATAEGGSDSGSNFAIVAYTDAGVGLATPLTITRSSGAWAIASPTATDAAFTSVTISARQNITATASKNFVGPSITLNTAITGGFSNTGAIQGYFFNNLRGLVSSGSDSGTLTTQIGVNGNVGNLNTDTKINPLTTSSIGYEATMNIRRGTITNSYGFFQAANVTLSAPSAWVTGTAYANNALVKPTVANGFYYVSSGGTSGGSEPVWPATSTAGQVPATVVDNDITWTEILIPAITNEYGVYITPTTSHNYFGGTVGIGSLTLNSSRFRIAGSISRSAWGNTGCQINVDASTTTDTSSSGTVASAVANGMGVPTFAASSATTFTDAATLRIGGGPSQGTSVTITNAWALWVDSDNIRADNGIALGTAGAGATGSAPLYPGVGQMTITTSAANTGGLITLGTTDTSITANDVIGTLDFYANDTSTSTNKNPARIQVIATNTIATDINPGQMDFYTTPTGVAAALTLGMSILNNQAVNIEKEIRVRGDIGGLASANTFTNVSDITANSTGVGTIKFKGTTSRDSSGFIKIYIGTTAYYIPVFSAITG